MARRRWLWDWTVIEPFCSNRCMIRNRSYSIHNRCISSSQRERSKPWSAAFCSSDCLYGCYSLPMTRSLLFRYMTIGPIGLCLSGATNAGKPQRNITLHLSVILGILLQLATVFVPGLRILLGLELPDALGFVLVASAILLSWGVAEAYGRLAATPGAKFMNTEQIPTCDWRL
jgi:hypothetical protein